MPHEHDGKVLIFTPYARDTQSLKAIFDQQAIESMPVPSLAAMVDELGDDVGAVVLSEEALSQSNWVPLIEAVNRQPSWSAYPFILLISKKRSFHESHAIYSHLPKEITNVMVLERPMGSAILISAVRWALAGRRRQFLTRNHLAELEKKTNDQRLLTRELAHRVKNMLAVVQSIVSQTMRAYPDMTDVKDVIVQRLSALSRAHDILFGADYSAADFGELVTATLAVHSADIHSEGVALRLSPQSSLSFSLVLHELATNSLKYGALSAGGRVDIGWKLVDGTSPRFEFNWAEHGGPPATTPVKLGFGTRLIKSTLTGFGDAHLLYEPTGFRLAFACDVSKLTHAV